MMRSYISKMLSSKPDVQEMVKMNSASTDAAVSQCTTQASSPYQSQLLAANSLQAQITS